MYGGETCHSFPTIISMKYIIKGAKHIMFVCTRNVGFLVDKLQFNFILFIPFFVYLLIYSFLYLLILYANFLLPSSFLINKISHGPTLLWSEMSQ